MGTRGLITLKWCGLYFVIEYLNSLELEILLRHVAKDPKAYSSFDAMLLHMRLHAHDIYRTTLLSYDESNTEDGYPIQSPCVEMFAPSLLPPVPTWGWEYVCIYDFHRQKLCLYEHQEDDRIYDLSASSLIPKDDTHVPTRRLSAPITDLGMTLTRPQTWSGLPKGKILELTLCRRQYNQWMKSIQGKLDAVEAEWTITDAGFTQATYVTLCLAAGLSRNTEFKTTGKNLCRRMINYEWVLLDGSNDQHITEIFTGFQNMSIKPWLTGAAGFLEFESMLVYLCPQLELASNSTDSIQRVACFLKSSKLPFKSAAVLSLRHVMLLHFDSGNHVQHTEVMSLTSDQNNAPIQDGFVALSRMLYETARAQLEPLDRDDRLALLPEIWQRVAEVDPSCHSICAHLAGIAWTQCHIGPGDVAVASVHDDEYQLVGIDRDAITRRITGKRALRMLGSGSEWFPVVRERDGTRKYLLNGAFRFHSETSPHYLNLS